MPQDSLTNSEYFGVAESISKESFLAVYESTMLCVQLLTAPFGLSQNVALLLGEQQAMQQYETVYRMWEDALSRKLYPKQGVPYDRMAASMHKYVEENRDHEVS